MNARTSSWSLTRTSGTLLTLTRKVSEIQRMGRPMNARLGRRPEDYGILGYSQDGLTGGKLRCDRTAWGLATRPPKDSRNNWCCTCTHGLRWGSAPAGNYRGCRHSSRFTPTAQCLITGVLVRVEFCREYSSRFSTHNPTHKMRCLIRLPRTSAVPAVCQVVEKLGRARLTR
jgi:hypothetical protein